MLARLPHCCPGLCRCPAANRELILPIAKYLDVPKENLFANRMNWWACRALLHAAACAQAHWWLHWLSEQQQAARACAHCLPVRWPDAKPLRMAVRSCAPNAMGAQATPSSAGCVGAAHTLPTGCATAHWVRRQWDDETGEPTRLSGFDMTQPTAFSKTLAIQKIREDNPYNTVVMIGGAEGSAYAPATCGGWYAANCWRPPV